MTKTTAAPTAKNNSNASVTPMPPMNISRARKDEFVQLVVSEGKAHYRDLPWRRTRDAYEVLVSEVMLQQTQVSRVQDRWQRFLHQFPRVDALASASTSDVLEQWQGLGYNRRALALKRCAEVCANTYEGAIPSEYHALVSLPGIGPATAAGVRAFSFDLPGVYLETNVRTVFLHEFFPNEHDVSDARIIPLVREMCPEKNVGAWYYALLDYGAHLKRITQNPSRRSKHYTKQSTFEGSRRQKRAEIVRCVLAQPGVYVLDVYTQLNDSERQQGRSEVPYELFEQLLTDLINEGFFKRENDSLVVD